MKLPIFGLVLLVLVGLAVASLTLDPENFDYGDVQQGNADTATVEFTSVDTIADNVTFTAGLFSYSNNFVSSYNFDGTVTFDPDTFNLLENGSQDVASTITVPEGTKMGQYTATYDVSYDNGLGGAYTQIITQQVTATVLVTPLTGSTGDLEINTDSFDDIPNQVRVDTNLELEIDIENDGDSDLSDVNLAVWIYDQTLEQVVAYDLSDQQTINDGQDEPFDISLDIHQDLDEDHNYNIYARAYQEGNMLTQYDIKSKDIEVLGEADLCDVGDLDINEFDLNEDEFTPGETVEVEVEVENDGNDDIEDLVVKVWLTERNDADEIEKEKSDKFDLDEDDTWDDVFEIELDDNLDDGTYEIHVRVYESGNEDEQCYEETKEIDIERPAQKVIIEDILISPISLTCDQTFTAQVDVQNIGDRDDDAVKVRMFNSELDIDVISDTFDLDEYDKSGDDETVYLMGAIPSDVDVKEYTLTFTLYYDDLDENDNYIERISVTDCNGQEDDGDDDETGEEDNQNQENTGNGNVVYLPTGFSVGDFFNSEGSKTLFWVLGNIALLIVIVYFVVLIFRKKKIPA